MNIPEISRSENEERRAQSIIERAVVASVTQGPMVARLARGGNPVAPAERSRNADGEEFFTFGNSLDGGASLAPG